MARDPRISLHALMRWIERVDGIDLVPLRRLARERYGDDDDFCVRRLIATMDVDLGAVERRMLTPAVVSAFETGVRSVQVLTPAGTAVLRLEGNVVVTVLMRHRLASVQRMQKAVGRSNRYTGGRRPQRSMRQLLEDVEATDG